MNSETKTLARIQFKSIIAYSDGNSFEDLFTKIMNYSEPDFQQIKAWGQDGDRKNDGYIKSKGTFFQVYAPEEIGKSYRPLISKIESDFNGLKNSWEPDFEIKKFHFVVNDKYNGVDPASEMVLEKIRKNNNLEISSFFTAKTLENILFKLPDDQIYAIIGFLPDPNSIKLDFSVLSEVIGHIMTINLPSQDDSNLIVPNWDDKIKFNKLCTTAKYLDAGISSVGHLEKYLKESGDSLAELLKDKIREIYIEEKLTGKSGDELFWSIVRKSAGKDQKMYQDAAIVIMSKYFESCDIFEEPKYSE